MKSCLTCKKLPECRDPKKAASYSCVNFHPQSKSNIDALWGDGLQLDKLIEKDKKERSKRGDSVLAIDTEKEEMNLVDMLDGLFDKKTNQMYNLEVDDRDFKEYPNFYQFCMSEEGANSPLWARQFYLCLTLLGEYCPTCSHKKYSKHIRDFPKLMDPLDIPRYLQLMEYGRCPKCGKTKLDHYKSRALSPYQEIACIAGQRIGKSLMTALISAYLTHKYVKIPDPARLFGLLKTTLFGTFVGLTYDKAIQQLWLPYKNILLDSPWFKGLHEMLKYTGERKGQELIKFGNTLHYVHKSILVYPSGPNKKTLRGNTRWLAAIDEADFFLNDEEGADQERMNGAEVHASLKNSMITVRASWKKLMKKGMVNVPNAFQLEVSSPSSIRGVLTTRATEHLDQPGKVFAIHLPTWEVHPDISEKMIREEFADEPEKAERDFGANPPMADNPFLTVDQAQMMLGQKPSLVKYKYIRKRAPNGQQRIAAKIEEAIEPSVLPPSIMSLDAGFSYNSFALSIGHVTKDKDGNRGAHFPIIVEVIPVKGVSVIDYSAMAEFMLYPLIERFNVQVVVADRWNSLKLLHDIDNRYEGRVLSEQYSLKYKDFFLVKSYIETGNIIVPAPEARTDNERDAVLRPDLKAYPSSYDYRPGDHFYLQACTVKDTGKEITKGERLTDDSWRTVVLGSFFLLDEAFCNEHLKESKNGRLRVGLGAMAGAGGLVGIGAGGSQMDMQQRIHDLGVGASSSSNMMAGRTRESLYAAMFSGRLNSPSAPPGQRQLRSHVKLPKR
jgi:hypothetical protein